MSFSRTPPASNYPQRSPYNSFNPHHSPSDPRFRFSPYSHRSPGQFSPRNFHQGQYTPRNRSPGFRSPSPNFHSHRQSFNSSFSSPDFNRSWGGSSNSSTPYGGPRKKYFNESRTSNPGHSHNIRDYINPSMLEDPWKELVAEYEKKRTVDDLQKPETPVNS